MQGLRTDYFAMLHKRKKHLLTAEQVQRLRAACNPVTQKGKRDLAILDTMLFQGLRLKEVASLRLKDFRTFGDQLTLHLQSRDCALKVHLTLRQSLSAWMDQMGVVFGDTRGPVFVSLANVVKDVSKPLGRQTISRLVAKYGYRAGLTSLKGPDRLTPGDLRRTCARTAYDRGAGLLSIQAFLGFNHLETVARYIGVLDLVDTDSAIDHIRYQ